jgi:eukaryotic-like serine/threonine-protein kinase
MNAAYPQHGQPAEFSNTGFRTLREALSLRAASGERLELETAVAQLVPLCIELAEIHAQGYGFYLHPSSISETADGRLVLAREMATQLPSDTRDRACLAPETQPDQLNDARANVYAIGAVFYELLTGSSVGAGMRRPAELVPSMPAALDGVLSVALITDLERRPDNLQTLAAAIQQLLASARPSVVPALSPLEMTLQGMPSSIPALNLRGPHPSLPVDMSLSLRSPNPSLPVDVSVSSIPPHLVVPRAAPPLIINGSNGAGLGVPPSSVGVPPSAAAVPPSSSLNGYGVAVQELPDTKGPAQAARFAELKAQLEADPRPRYFMIKAGMDHGPFTAVELVRQIDAHSFTDEDHVVDSIEGRRAPLPEWPQFALFAEHAKRERQLAQRQKDIVKVAAAEKKSTRGKTLAGLLMLIGVLAVGGGWYTMKNAERRDGVVIQEDESTNVETDGALSIKGKKKARRRSSGGSTGSIPVVAGGQSCEAALDAYNEDKSMGEEGQADISAGQYGRVLNSGSYFSHCGVPFSMSVSICAAVQNGRAVGVTVTTQPNDGKRAACVAGAVRSLNFPSHPKLDVTKTRFDAQ